MLHWPHKNVYKKIQVWGQLFAVSAGAHLCVLLIMFVWYRGRDNNESVAIHRTLLAQGIPVVVLAHAKAAAPSCAVIAQPKSQPIQQIQRKKIEPMPRTVVQAPPKTTVVKKEVVAAKKEAPKSEKKKEQQLVKKEEPIKQPVKPIEKKVVAKKEPAAPKVAEQVAKAVPTNIEKVPHAVVPQQEALGIAKEEIMVDGPIIVAKDYREKIVIKKHQMLQQELTRVWHPPVGVQDGCSCQMRVIVGSDGTVRGVNVVDSSGVLMFDVAARSALCSAQLPKWTWGTSIDITFN